MAVNIDSVKDALTHKYGPLPGYAWAGLGAIAIVIIVSRRSSSSSSTPAFLTTPPVGAVTGPGDNLGAGGGGSDGDSGGEPNVTPTDVSTPTPDGGSTGGDGVNPGGLRQPAAPATTSIAPAIVTAEPLPALAPFADALVARGVDPSTGGLLPGAGNSSGVAGSPVPYGPGLYDQTPTVATPAGPVPGGVYRASDPTDFGVPGPAPDPGPTSPQNGSGVIAPILAAPAPAAPSGESMIAAHFRLGRDTLDV